MSVHNHRTKELSYREQRVPCPKCIELLNAAAEIDRLREQGWHIEGDAGGTVEAHADDAPSVSPSLRVVIENLSNATLMELEDAYAHLTKDQKETLKKLATGLWEQPVADSSGVHLASEFVLQNPLGDDGARAALREEPDRSYMEHPAERAIQEAVDRVEEMGAHLDLTAIVHALGKQREAVEAWNRGERS